MEIHFESNPLIDRLPQHLKQFIIPQNYEDYTPINQAVWRYVMRKNVDYLSKVAHDSYLKGLQQTGIDTNNIPNMYGMNRILKEIGWAAVAVDGFIPPSAFMEFQAYNVLVIACDIRQLEHIEYTPAPDIIHEGAGHAPIIANPEYAEYLRRFGEIGCKAISSARDYELYEAIRLLSILKEAENTPEEEIKKAEEQVYFLQNNMGEPSEMAQIRNLHWWTVEYGLIGTIETPKIYGAGLLSSIGESEWCMTDNVKKIPYNLSAANQSFDITKPQPQLYVTPDFAHLSLVLEEFANKMALRTGGLSSIQKLINSKALGTIELSTGLQISGVFTNVIENENKPVYIQSTGKTALSYREKELVGHGTQYHAEGFGSPIGKLKGINLAIEDMSPRDLCAYDIYEGKQITLEFEGDIKVTGEIITGTRNIQGKILIIKFKNCTVTYGQQVLFQPEWGIYDMAVGKEIISAFSGPADANSFDMISHVPSTKTIKQQKSAEREELEQLYLNVRNIREEKKANITLNQIFDILTNNHPNDWLLAIEIIEIAHKENNDDLANKILNYLENVKIKRPETKKLIQNGLDLIFKKVFT
ncbi:phenylalanine 4-monooxygenase [Flavobacterium columnare NBRC 100251 = ATCC 23463]|uniref:Phenylalanine 4-monooxygenase n=1 Tax=Flavobacterium columnare (strain ATCC 49512 / CIP 103533 / TG 44/87) TaxID=1041826 RepID=G8X695_FLACA|nr:aromatic amino acid hydroxylase [Flavobacterium columnare]AEW86936.1 phenylalanine 4-monooxygenase [Flavobacterium columnare ATCC 49512]ANO47747.1 phenylalanine 4-monooxygenase [Flavobacterium columnare]APT21643.1 phenylalanine 4-monooxygenase [Flavobacterium columnare]PDS25317.1 phenylalanine 4-monooxygenase [Flavobacterium columnare NBRC 100251 = ATCC 23463]GEM57082.1 phenylalanine 4-monooxygenase [Flavobacterium columnare NBRC 100251 = ATCC 23463]